MGPPTTNPGSCRWGSYRGGHPHAEEMKVAVDQGVSAASGEGGNGIGSRRSAIPTVTQRFRHTPLRPRRRYARSDPAALAAGWNIVRLLLAAVWAKNVLAVGALHIEIPVVVLVAFAANVEDHGVVFGHILDQRHYTGRKEVNVSWYMERYVGKWWIYG